MSFDRRRFLQSVSAGASLPVLASGARAANRPRVETDQPDLPRDTRLANIAVDGTWHLAAATEHGVLDVVAAADALDIDVPQNTDALFAYGGGRAVERVITRALAGTRVQQFFYSETQAHFGPCVLAPEKIVCVGLNYRKHAAEVGQKPPETPILFNKYNNALLGHGGVLKLPTAVAKAFDYEVELVIVIGRKTEAVGVEQALSHVAGYCTGNDMSARDLQRRTSQFMLGKSCDGFAPVGPWLVSADRVPNPNGLALSTHVNGERRQSSNTSDMIFNCAQLVSYISRHMTLRAGDIIFTGTPEGVIAGYPPERQVWLKAGDEVRCEIETLGELRFVLA